MNDAILAPIEAMLRRNPANAELIGAYVEAGLAANLPDRVCDVLQSLAIVPSSLGQDLQRRIGKSLVSCGSLDRANELGLANPISSQMEQVRSLLSQGDPVEAGHLYRSVVAENPAAEDKQLEAELSGRVVRLDPGQRRERVRSVSNDDTDVVALERLKNPELPRVTFASVGGLEHVKDQIRRRIITPFQKPSLFRRFRKTAGGGVLLYGPPGCGKTLLARATAGECGATFHNVSVSDVLDMYIGESERKLHALFDQARRTRPSVMFFDEVEALGGKRQNSRDASSSKLVSQFLSELDGFAQNNQDVLILAATNVPWAVDPAFRRPGRFDRVLFVPPPDRSARIEILRQLVRDRPVAGQLEIESIAIATSGYSGADLRDLVETAIDEAIERSIAIGEEVPLTDALLKQALAQSKSTTLEWLTTARNYARYANEGGQYDEVLSFLREQSAR